MNDWPCVLRVLRESTITDANLVLTAVQIPSRIDREDGVWCLRVPHELSAAALVELEAYARENVTVAMPPAPARIDSGWVGVIAYLLLVWGLPTLQREQAFGWPWEAIGILDAAQVLNGQWWRAVTALTLHADLGHLIGNSVFGAVFGLMLGRHFGSGLGWALVLVCGALGNFIDAGLRGDEFRALGASTATFAMLAMVGTFVARRGYHRGVGWRRRVAPAFAAFAMLTLTGLGGERTDLVAHLAGFAVGCGAGWMAARFELHRLPPVLQWTAGGLALATVVMCWLLAGAHR